MRAVSILDSRVHFFSISMQQEQRKALATPDPKGVSLLLCDIEKGKANPKGVGPGPGGGPAEAYKGFRNGASRGMWGGQGPPHIVVSVEGGGKSVENQSLNVFYPGQ